MNAALAAFGILISLSSFGNESVEQALLAKIQNQNPEYQVHKITKWQYKGHTYYELETSRCCDIPRILLDENGERYCSLGGGYANRAESQCADFDQKDVKKFLGYLSEKTEPVGH